MSASTSVAVLFATLAGARDSERAQASSLGSYRASHLNTQRSLRCSSAATAAAEAPARTRRTADRRNRSSGSFTAAFPSTAFLRPKSGGGSESSAHGTMSCCLDDTRDCTMSCWLRLHDVLRVVT